MATVARRTEGGQSHRPNHSVSSRPAFRRGGVSKKSPGCQPNPLIWGHAADQPKGRKERGLDSADVGGRAHILPGPVLPSAAHTHPLASNRRRRQGSHQSPRKDRMSFRPAMLPDVPTARHGKSQCPGTDRLMPGVSDTKAWQASLQAPGTGRRSPGSLLSWSTSSFLSPVLPQATLNPTVAAVG